MTQCHNQKDYYNLEAMEAIAPFFFPLAIISSIATVYTYTFKIIIAAAILHLPDFKHPEKLGYGIDDMYHYNLDSIKCYFGISNYYNPYHYNDLSTVRLNHDVCLKKGLEAATGVSHIRSLLNIIGYELWNKPEDIAVDIEDCKQYAFDTYVLRLEDQPSTMDA